MATFRDLRLFVTNDGWTEEPNLGRGRRRTGDHRRDYRAAMASIRTPILLIAGNKDRIAPPRSVKDASELCGSSDKRFVIASRGQAMKANYGHLDLLIGEHAAADVYPLVQRWLAGERDRGAAVVEKGPLDAEGASAES